MPAWAPVARPLGPGFDVVDGDDVAPGVLVDLVAEVVEVDKVDEVDIKEAGALT